MHSWAWMLLEVAKACAFNPMFRFGVSASAASHRPIRRSQAPHVAGSRPQWSGGAPVLARTSVVDRMGRWRRLGRYTQALTFPTAVEADGPRIPCLVALPAGVTRLLAVRLRGRGHRLQHALRESH